MKNENLNDEVLEDIKYFMLESENAISRNDRKALREHAYSMIINLSCWFDMRPLSEIED